MCIRDRDWKQLKVTYVPTFLEGKSLTFEGFIIVGYLFGLAGKFFGGNLTYVVAFYLLDILMVTTDLLLTLRNRRLDAEEERRAKA